MQENTVLVIAPHHDDEVIGCGGTTQALKKLGWNILVQHIFDGSSGVRNLAGTKSTSLRVTEAENAAKLGGYKILPNLGIIDRKTDSPVLITSQLIHVFRKINPNIVFVPHDEEQDFEHQIVAKAAWEASWLASTSNFLQKNESSCNSIKLYLGYEVWRPISLVNTHFNISEFVDMKKKLLQQFESQMELTSWIEGSLGLNAYRGAMLQGKGYAEAFTVRNLGSSELQKLFALK